MTRTTFVITIAQVNPTVGDIAANARLIRRVRDDAPKHSNLIVFPELVLTGYPPEDLLLSESFLRSTQDALEKLVDESRGRSTAMLVTAPFYNAVEKCLYNAAHLIHDGKIIGTTLKHHLPNYGVFDEQRYFTNGPLPHPMSFMGVKLGVLICEDMWFPDAAEHLAEHGADMLIVTNASPYEAQKHNIRLQHAQLRVEKTGLPLIFVNQWGGQDDLVFDGASFMMNETGRVILQSQEFMEEFQDLTFSRIGDDESARWLIATEDRFPIHTETDALYLACMTGLRDYVHKNNIPHVLLGLSGGIDSALVAAIAVDALGADRVRAVMMPSPFTAPQSIKDAESCAKNLNIAYEVRDIQPMLSAFETIIPEAKNLAHENLQARIRGTILMTLANQSGGMVLSTGNKSEVAVGYCTLYGDMCGGYNPIKDVYKTQVYNLANWRNAHKPENGLGPDHTIIPKSILTKAPSAELRANQKDQDSLPPYDELDQILMMLIEEDISPADIINDGFERDVVEQVAKLVKASEHKRRQSAPGPKISSRAFARERRYPITNGFSDLPVDLNNKKR
jgi:NAD+ synthase